MPSTLMLLVSTKQISFRRGDGGIRRDFCSCCICCFLFPSFHSRNSLSFHAQLRISHLFLVLAMQSLIFKMECVPFWCSVVLNEVHASRLMVQNSYILAIFFPFHIISSFKKKLLLFFFRDCKLTIVCVVKLFSQCCHSFLSWNHWIAMSCHIFCKL